MADDKVKVKLLRPLDGKEEGDTAEYARADAERLAGYGAVEIIRKAAPAHRNKARAGAPSNKSAPARKRGR